MALPGPTVDGPTTLRLSRRSWRERRYVLGAADDALGELVSTSSWKNAARAEAAGDALDLGRDGFMRRRTVARHPGTSEELAIVERGRIGGPGETYTWKREKGWRGGPWVLAAGDRAVARLESHAGSKDRRVEVELLDGATVSVLLLLVACFVLIADDDEGAAAGGAAAGAT